MAKLAEELARLAKEAIEKEKSSQALAPATMRDAVREFYEKLVAILRVRAAGGMRREVVDLLNGHQYPESLREKVFPHPNTCSAADIAALAENLAELLQADGFRTGTTLNKHNCLLTIEW